MLSKKIPHGLNGYINHGCRCKVCRKAKADYNTARASGKWKRQRKDPIQHGTIKGYSARGCRCAKCKLAASAYQAGRRSKTVARS